MFLTLGGVAYVDTGSDPTFFNNFISFSNVYLGLFGYISYIVYLLLYIVLIRSIYIVFLNYKSLKSINKEN